MPDVKTLAQVIGWELTSGSYDGTRAYRYIDVPVVEKYSLSDLTTWKRWPGKHKNVTFWVVLENGRAVGFNENPSHGLSFPVVRVKN